MTKNQVEIVKAVRRKPGLAVWLLVFVFSLARLPVFGVNILVTLQDFQGNPDLGDPCVVQCNSTPSAQAAGIASLYKNNFTTDPLNGQFTLSNAIPGWWTVTPGHDNTQPFSFFVPQTNAATLRAEWLWPVNTNATDWTAWSAALGGYYSRNLYPGNNVTFLTNSDGSILVSGTGGGGGAAIVPGASITTNVLAGGVVLVSVTTNSYDPYGAAAAAQAAASTFSTNAANVTGVFNGPLFVNTVSGPDLQLTNVVVNSIYFNSQVAGQNRLATEPAVAGYGFRLLSAGTNANLQISTLFASNLDDAYGPLPPSTNLATLNGSGSGLISLNAAALKGPGQLLSLLVTNTGAAYVLITNGQLLASGAFIGNSVAGTADLDAYIAYQGGGTVAIGDNNLDYNGVALQINQSGSIAAVGASFTGNGSGLTNLNAAKLTGTLPNAVLPPYTVTNASAVVITNFGGFSIGGWTISTNPANDSLNLTNQFGGIPLTTNLTMTVSNLTVNGSMTAATAVNVGGSTMQSTYMQSGTVYANWTSGTQARAASLSGNGGTNLMISSGIGFGSILFNSASWQMNSNAYNLGNLTNQVGNFGWSFGLSNNCPVLVYSSNAVNYIFYLTAKNIP